MIKNEIGNKYSRLLVMRRAENDKRGNAQWVCKCECGNVVTVRGAGLRSGHNQSCGCLNAEKDKTHGMTKTPEFKAWQSMHQRCSNPKNQRFAYYGARGIKVADEWQSFDVFYSDMGSRPSAKHSLNRIDNNGHYCKRNCEWATDTEQSRNRSGLRILSYDGKTLPLSEWCERKELKRSCVTSRLRKGWSVEKALNTPSARA